MRREVLIEDLKKLYMANDMAKTDCGGCEGCSQCCQGMGESVILDPYDIYCLEKGLKTDFNGLLQFAVELNVADAVVLPNIRMNGEQERCVFLDDQDRCGIHEFRPGFCRLFPLGRYYESGDFRYFLQSRECPKEPKTKVKISKWLGIPNIKTYENFVKQWHNLIEEIREMPEKLQDEQLGRDLNTYLLENFYIQAYHPQEEFYQQFLPRYEKMKKLLAVINESGEARREK